MSIECPKCHRPLSNRRRTTCAYCGSAVPPELRTKNEQGAAIEQMKASEAAAHQKWMEQQSLIKYGRPDSTLG